MTRFLINLSSQRRYWAALVIVGVALEAAALFYQYVLDEWPCVLCIHVRIWVAAFILLGLLAMILVQYKALGRIAHALNTVIMLGMLERSYQVLAIERGWVFGDCDMDLGMPAWFALDQWLPSVFEVQTSCGYTPLLLFNITMADVLVLTAAGLLITSLTLFIASWFE